MKQVLASTLLLITISGLFSCSPTKKPFAKKTIDSLDISYNFSNPAVTKAFYAEPGQPINLTLTNINPNIYNVSVNDSLVVYQTQKPDQFEGLFNKMPDLAPVTGTVTPPPTAVVAIAALPSTFTGIPRAKADSEYTRNETAITLLDRELNFFLTVDYINLKQEFEKNVDYADMPVEISSWATTCSLTVAERIAKVDAYILDNFSSFAANSIPLGIESFINKETKSFKDNLMTQEEKANELIKRYAAIKESTAPDLTFTLYKVVEKNISEKTDKLKSALDNISKMKDKVKELEKAKIGAAIAESYKKISESEIEKVIHKYIPRKAGDEYLIKVNIEKKVTNSNCSKEPASFTIPVYIEKGIKIDFSTGVVFNFGRDKFFDQKYRYDSVSRPDGSFADSVKIVKRKSNNISQVSIGAFGHVYTRIRREFNLGGMFGVSLSADQRVYYHAGLSALIGKNDRFIISTGVSVAKAKYLDTQYDVDQVMKRSLAPTTIPVEEVTRAGFFISLSYNLNLIK